MLSTVTFRQGLLALAATLISTTAFAQTAVSGAALRMYGPPAPAVVQPAYSSSLMAYAAPEETFANASAARPMSASAGEMRAAAYFGGYQAEGASTQRTIRPFSDMAAQIKFGAAGLGFDLATPLAQHFNLRGGAAFFSYQTGVVADGLHIDGNANFTNAFMSVDYFPFHSGFHISPGITFYNDTSLNANLTVPGGQSFSFGDYDATSDPNDPIAGSAAIHFGHKVAPRLTMGWGNMIPRKGDQRWSVPVEVGVQFASRPTIRFNIHGQGCSYQTEPDGSVDYGCGPVDQGDIAQEQQELQDDVSGLRFFPVFSIGLSYRFGLGGR